MNMLKNKFATLLAFGLIQTTAFAPRGAGTGLHTLADLQKITDQTIRQFGLESVMDTLAAELTAHNTIADQMTADVAMETPEREEAVGGTLSFDMEEADENNRPRGQKPGTPDKVGYPLRRFTAAVGFNAEFLNNAKPVSLAERVIEMQAAHTRKIIAGVRHALLTPVNYSFRPYIADLRDIAVDVKMLYNGDGFVPPVGPQAQIFDGTHNHFIGAATLTNAVVTALVNNVTEHSLNAKVKIWISGADESTWRALTEFRPYVDIRERPSMTRDVALSTPLDTTNTSNRAIGIQAGAEIWVKPWMPASYVLAVNVNAPDKALRKRVPVDVSRRGLRPIAEVANFPYQANVYEGLFGFGVYNRGAAAALFIGNATYQNPNLTP
jgi:hypothetical protein